MMKAETMRSAECGVRKAEGIDYEEDDEDEDKDKEEKEEGDEKEEEEEG